MDSHLFLQVLGYVASVLVAASLMMKSLSGCGSSTSSAPAHGDVRPAHPRVAGRGVQRHDRARGPVLPEPDVAAARLLLLAVAHDSEYLRGFVEFHRDEIASFIPGYAYQPVEAHHHLLVLRNMVPGGS